MNSIIINNVRCTKVKNGIQMVPLSLLKKYNVEYSHIPVAHFGSKFNDHEIIRKLADSEIKLEQLL